MHAIDKNNEKKKSLPKTLFYNLIISDREIIDLEQMREEI